MVLRKRPDSSRLTGAKVWLNRVKAPSSRERPLACAHEAEPPPAGSQREQIVSDSRSSGAQRCKY
eukprot:3707579-Pyramimonas_sp.AAC.1